MIYNGTMKYFSLLPPGDNPEFDDVGYECDIKDCRKNGQSIDNIIHQVSQKLNRVTKMNTILR